MAASSLLARSSRRFVSNLAASSSVHPRGFSSSPSPSPSPSLEELRRRLVQKWDFYGKVMAKLNKHVLVRLPHTLCRTARGDTLEAVSLSIPGNEKRTETDEALHVFLDFDARKAKGICIRPELDTNCNVLFVRASVQPTSDASFNRYYSSRINLGNDIMYKTIHTETKDGGVLLTFHKNPDNVEPIKFN